MRTRIHNSELVVSHEQIVLMASEPVLEYTPVKYELSAKQVVMRFINQVAFSNFTRFKKRRKRSSEMRSYHLKHNI